MRGSLIDLFPAGEELALRLDFFGDEIDSLRRFDPADQRSTDKAEAFTLMPASEALLDEDSIKRFRSRYREKFGATATQDPLYQALSEGRRMAGMEHWLPLLEERLATLFDHLGENDLVLRDAGADKALEARREAIEDYYQNRVRAMAAEPGSYRPLEPRRALPLEAANGTRSSPTRPIHLASPFPEPESRPHDRLRRRAGARLRARARPAGQCLRSRRGACRRSCAEGGHKVVLASYTKGARERLRGLLEDHGLKAQKLADSWQEALGAQDPAGAARPAARPRLHHARRRRPHRAGHARRPPRPPAQEAQGRRRLPRRSWRRCRPATSSSTPTTASAATRG